MSNSKVKWEYKELIAGSAKRFYGDHCSPAMDSGDMSIKDMETGLIYIYPRPHDGFEITSWDLLKPEKGLPKGSIASVSPFDRGISADG